MAFVVGIRGHLPGKRVILPIQWVEDADPGGRVRTGAGRDGVRSAPRLNTERPVSPAQLDEVIAYYSGLSSAV